LPALLFLAVFHPSSLSSLDVAAYWKNYEPACLEAREYASEIRPLLFAALDNDELLTRVGMAVVFPELTRYSFLQDAIETSALEFSYLFYGTVDFSIGKMQMKPSFAARLEADALPCCRSRFPELFAPAEDERAARGARLLRLKNSQKQVEYFAVFLRLVKEKFPGLENDPEKMVKIFSTAYNSGFNKGREELEAGAGRFYFPHGKHSPGEQYSYGEIALYYFQKFEQPQAGAGAAVPGSPLTCRGFLDYLQGPFRAAIP
jgi:hypothetical protein